jgi:hypothetical protein
MIVYTAEIPCIWYCLMSLQSSKFRLNVLELISLIKNEIARGIYLIYKLLVEFKYSTL